MSSQKAFHPDIHTSMTSPGDSPSFGNHTADLGFACRGKIGRAIPKRGREAPAVPDSYSSEEKMKKDQTQSNGVEAMRIRKARHFIQEHCGEEISLRHVAKAASTSPNYLSEKFKQATGVNFVRYVARVRYEKAAELLCQSNLRISEIAFATGFQSLSQFNRTFRKLAGKSPTNYRASLNGHSKDRRNGDYSPSQT
jgi:AraC-like DNA-binding protein